MNDSYGYPMDGLAWRLDVAARVRDILGRKPAQARENVAKRFLRVAQRLRGAIPQAQFRAAVQECLTSLRREARLRAGRGRAGRQSVHLCEEIRAYRSRESIENYGAFLFDLPSCTLRDDGSKRRER